jgi:hypothetical protein
LKPIVGSEKIDDKDIETAKIPGILSLGSRIENFPWGLLAPGRTLQERHSDDKLEIQPGLRLFEDLQKILDRLFLARRFDNAHPQPLSGSPPNADRRRTVSQMMRMGNGKCFLRRKTKTLFELGIVKRYENRITFSNSHEGPAYIKRNPRPKFTSRTLLHVVDKKEHRLPLAQQEEIERYGIFRLVLED